MTTTSHRCTLKRLPPLMGGISGQEVAIKTPQSQKERPNGTSPGQSLLWSSKDRMLETN